MITPDSLRTMIESYVKEYPEIHNEKNIWRIPLLVTAKADERFDILPEIAASDHVLPRDLLPTAKSVIVFFVSFTKELAKENHKGEIPCRNWGLAYQSTNRLINRFCEYLKEHLNAQGFASALIPATHNFDHRTLQSRWSHKHLAHIANLGRFGVNAQMITPSGCAGRLGSLVTEADLGDSPLVYDDELCLYKMGGKCLACYKRCPVQAISESGIDRKRCWDRLNDNLDTEELKGLEETTHVCAKCQVFVPCSMKAPKLKEHGSTAAPS